MIFIAHQPSLALYAPQPIASSYTFDGGYQLLVVFEFQFPPLHMPVLYDFELNILHAKSFRTLISAAVLGCTSG
jgi:hypothetical protein